MYENEPTVMGSGRSSATLVVRQGPQAGTSFPVLGNQVIIGREEEVDIILQDPEASRKHARLSWQGGQFVLEDMGSTNGTFVNGIQITAPRILNSGDSIGIGQTALVFQMAGMPSGSERAPVQSPSYATPHRKAEGQRNTTQYVLYGCGCLLLLFICILLALVAWALVSPETFGVFTGINIQY